MKKRIIIPITIVSLVVATTLVMVGVSKYGTYGFRMEKDNDSGFYTSLDNGFEKSKSAETGFLTYNDGVLTAKKFFWNNAVKYSPEKSEAIALDKSTAIVGDIEITLNKGSLAARNTATEKKEVIAEDCSRYFFNGERLIYTVDNSVFIADASDFFAGSRNIPINRRIAEKYDDAVYLNGVDIKNSVDRENLFVYLGVEDDDIFAATYSDMVCEFFVYDIDTLDEKSYMNYETVGRPEWVGICGHTFAYYSSYSSSFNTVDFDNGTVKTIEPAAFVKGVATNGKAVFYISEKTEGELIIRTANAPRNGVWSLDPKTGENKRLSEECDYCDLLATDNYVYCYKEVFWFPRGTADGWVRDFELTQIKI